MLFDFLDMILSTKFKNLKTIMLIIQYLFYPSRFDSCLRIFTKLNKNIKNIDFSGILRLYIILYSS